MITHDCPQCLPLSHHHANDTRLLQSKRTSDWSAITLCSVCYAGDVRLPVLINPIVTVSFPTWEKKKRNSVVHEANASVTIHNVGYSGIMK